MMNCKKHSKRHAFTLIEIMLSIMIFSMVLAAIYSTWILILRSTKVAQEAAAEVQRQRIAVRTIEDSLMCIQSFQASLQYYTFIVQNGDTPELSFVARLPDNFPRNGRFGDFNLRRLTYTVEPDADATLGNDLMLRQNPILMDMDQDEQNFPLVLAHNVKDFVVECWDTNALDWTDEWDNTNSIPPMMRVTLALVGKKNDSSVSAPELDITRVIAIPSSMVPSVLQNGIPGGGGGGGIGSGGNGGRGTGTGNGGNNQNGNPNGNHNPNSFNNFNNQNNQSRNFPNFGRPNGQQ
jgi:prepilin-type N-terminal cleavage/methylation domain-containing protein